MSFHIKGVTVAVAAAFLLFAPAARAFAEPAVAVDDESQRLSAEIAHDLIKNMDFQALMQKDLGEFDHMFDDIRNRPEWPRLMREAAMEESTQFGPAMERAMGRAFARYFTLEELRAGVEFMRGPGGDALSVAVREASAGRPTPPATPTLNRELQKLARRPAGRAFIEKFGNIGKVIDSVTPDLMAWFVLDLLHRFTDKAIPLEGRGP